MPVTLGGGTLVGALYLGVIGGFEFLWLQPLAMLCGIIMLGAISYVTLSKEDSKDRPFELVRRHVSPLLAWGWLIATIVANEGNGPRRNLPPGIIALHFQSGQRPPCWDPAYFRRHQNVVPLPLHRRIDTQRFDQFVVYANCQT